MNTTVSQLKAAFSIRIVVCDHYLTKPIPGIDVIYSDFRGSDIKQVPVLRIFGSTPDGYKACLHIHGVFPYFYIPCPTPNPQPQFLYQIAASLDKALNIALKQASSSNQHVYKISLVKGLPFYGYHDKDHLYLKVFLYNPGLIKQAVELCCNGAILGQTFQPHESHLNFTLQFFIDFNLFGMSNIDLQAVKYRKMGQTQNSNDPLSPDEVYLKPESICYYEVDCVANHIINRQRIGKGDGIENPGLEEVWNQERERRKQLNVSMASKSLSQGRLKSEETDSHYKFEQMFLMKMSNLIDKPVLVENNLKVIQEVHYPAESMEGSQLFKAVDISMHLPDNSMCMSFDTTLTESNETLGIDDTIVDENLALNSSLHYSQVTLNNDDLEFVDMLQDMDEKPIEDDSVLGTPAELDQDADTDDLEYSQIFNNETILLDNSKSKVENDESSPSWNDSFWDDANIPQLDGTCDDDHVKKVRKRKMRSFKLGLSRPRGKNQDINCVDKLGTTMELDDVDEINVSRETIDNISDLHIKRSVKVEPVTNIDSDLSSKDDTTNDSITNLVNKVTERYEKVKTETAYTYDIINKFQPIAGPSTSVAQTETYNLNDFSFNTSDTSPEENNKEIMSFYNMSKIFDVSLENDKQNQSLEDNTVQLDQNSTHLNVETPVDIKVAFKNEITTNNKVILTPKIKPPTKEYILASLEKYNIPKQINHRPYYSDHKDVGDKVELGQILLKLHSNKSKDQKPFERLNTTSIEEWRQLMFLQSNEINEGSTKPEALKLLLASNKQCILRPVKNAPTTKEVVEWLKNSDKKTVNKSIACEISNIYDNDDLDNTQAIGLNEDEVNSSLSLGSDKERNLDTTLQVTMQPDGSFLCFGSSNQEQDFNKTSIEAPTVEVDFLTVMLAEVLTSIRGDMHPDPSLDQIRAVFIAITNDCPNDHFLAKHTTEILVVDEDSSRMLDKCISEKVTYFSDENTLLETVIQLVQQHDPDIMCGYDIEMSSWGYILERAQVLGMEVVKEMSRITEKYRQKRWRSDENDFEGRIIGRITFNVWRLFRYELALSSYSFENCMYEVLKERVPRYSYAQLWEWWSHESNIFRWIPVEYYLTKLSGTVRMLQKLDIINRTSELARLFGLQWWEVLSRGSQFRVESLMLRAARPLNLIALSPSVRQRAAMKAPEYLPLIFEPESRFYSDPVIVLDFQSLYPSMMIAYNYCFSTCIGRVQNINGDSDYEFGAWRLKIPKSKLEALNKKGLIHWSPVGVGYVKSSVRRGVLPSLLRRILAARQAVKKGMKLQTDENVKKAMHSRQLGLKLIANVTYGYTAANFSGRMPCVEVADSVVAKGRETLERAIKLVRNSHWNARVVYGDTDSMFVLVPGGTKAEAFEIGQQIADAVTADNPSPVALKLEKVYQPCILQTKKRYVGYMYESPDQETPVYEAKGIETVRRDGCPAGVKLLKRALCELFESGDMSKVKRGVVSLLSQLVDGTLPPQELFFTREYHGPTGYRPGAAAPPHEIAKRISSRDRRAVPRSGWRVPWLVCAGAPGMPLVRLAHTPAELLLDPALGPHVAYYVTRVLLPPLHRCLSLLGVDVFKWWSELGFNRESGGRVQTGGIARYMWRSRCASCGARGTRALCSRCAATPQPAGAALAVRLNNSYTHRLYCDTICRSCCGHLHTNQCENTECPILWKRLSIDQKIAQNRDIVTNLPPQFKKESLDFLM